jgi:hypothetical protein
MEGHLEALLEMDFCTKPPNFGAEAHMEAPAGDALSRANRALIAGCSYCRPVLVVANCLYSMLLLLLRLLSKKRNGGKPQ